MIMMKECSWRRWVWWKLYGRQVVEIHLRGFSKDKMTNILTD
jgi:hypothetical protein